MNGEPTIRSGRDHVKQLAPARGAPLDGLAFGAPVISDFLPEVRELFGESVPVYPAAPSRALLQPPRHLPRGSGGTARIASLLWLPGEQAWRSCEQTSWHSPLGRVVEGERSL